MENAVYMKGCNRPTRFIFTLLLLLVSVSVLAPQAFAEKTPVDPSDRLGLSDAERAWWPTRFSVWG